MKELPDTLIAEMKERLLVHFAAGAWRVPVSVRAVAGGLGPVVAGGAADVARVMRTLRARDGSPPLAGALRALAPETAAVLRDLRRAEGFDDDPLAVLPVALPDLPPGAVLLSAAATPVSVLVALLEAGARGGLVWKPAPGAAASAHLVMDASARHAPGALAMVQGDHATAALLAQEGPVIWASPAPPPMTLRPVLTLAARAPRSR